MSIGIRSHPGSVVLRGRCWTSPSRSSPRPPASGCQRLWILKNLAATSRVPPSTPSRKLWKRPAFNSLQRMEGGRASGCGYSRIALRLSVIGQRVLRLPPTVPLITRSLGVSATMDRGCDKSERLQWFARSQVGKTVYTRQQIEGHGETHVHGKHEYSAKPCRASGVRDSGYRRSLLGLR